MKPEIQKLFDMLFQKSGENDPNLTVALKKAKTLGTSP